ncbi:putative dynein heavy chain [Trypanosoma grayi]|uniref:putative dynein heavy chain n=1 Tax=Trypanosoma grayi TaxID=71804 RepID=UPI0004F48A0A|nr:putative dynein heavy chain [Trypanosoma grayi]KEG14122.1 putative dynein heavy chain [Trypanosoma grayi]
MGDTTGSGVLRRAYTRSMPTTLRPLALLEESMADVRAQWHAVLAGISPDEENTPAIEVRAALRQVERLASQLKAIKQELVPQINHVTSQDVSEESFLHYCTSAATAAALCGTTQHDRVRLTRLAACVWVWSVCVATVLNDLELLSGSLSFAATCGLFEGTVEEAITSEEEAYAFFFGKTASGATTLRDRDVMLVCELLYHLYTRNDAAAEVAVRRITELMDISGEPSAYHLYMEDVLDDVTRMAVWVATEDYGALNAFVTEAILAEKDGCGSVPPLVLFFTQMMLDNVVQRQLVQAGFQNAWRPVVGVEAPATGSMAEPVECRDALRHCAVESRKFLVCRILQCESLPPRGAWPFPADFADNYFRVDWWARHEAS